MIVLMIIVKMNKIKYTCRNDSGSPPIVTLLSHPSRIYPQGIPYHEVHATTTVVTNNPTSPNTDFPSLTLGTIAPP